MKSTSLTYKILENDAIGLQTLSRFESPEDSTSRIEVRSTSSSSSNSFDSTLVSIFDTEVILCFFFVSDSGTVMKVSLNAFVAEVRRHFGKYTPLQQSRILHRFSIALSVFSLVIIGTGVFLDQFHAADPLETKIENTEFTYYAPGMYLGHKRLKLLFPECVTPETGDRIESVLFDTGGVSFEKLSRGPTGKDEVFDAFVTPEKDTLTGQYFGNFKTYTKLGLAGSIFSYVAFGLQLASLIISVFSGSPPSSFMTSKPLFGQSEWQRIWGMTHHLLSFLAVVCLFVDLLLVSLYMDLVVGRVVELGFELCNLSPGLDELPLMQFYGRFLDAHTNLDGMTGTLFKVAMALTMIQLVFVFFLGTDHVRSESLTSGYSLPASKVRQLPWFSGSWRFPFALLFLAVSLMAFILSSLYARDHGYRLNRYTWRSVTSTKTGTGSTLSGAFSDFFMDLLASFYISETLPRSVTWVTLLFVFALAIGSTDPTRFVSKVTQLIGILFTIQSFSSISTLVPIPSGPLASPGCYSPPPPGTWSLRRIFQRVYCNHLMFCMDAAIMTMSMCVIMSYIRYGPIGMRLPGYIIVLVFTCAFILLPIAARTSYSIDVFIGVLISGLLVFSQSPAFKMLFRFENVTEDLDLGVTKLNFQPGEILNDKVVPIMLECLRRVELYRMAACNLPGLAMDMSELEEIKVLYKELGHAVDTAESAKPLVPMSASGALRPLSLSHDIQAETPPDTDINDIIALMSRHAPTQDTPVPIGILPSPPGQSDTQTSEKSPE